MKKISFFKIYIPIISILVIILCILAVKLNEKNSNIINTTESNIKFMEEYTSLNGKTDELGNNYNDVSITNDNIYYYANENEIIELLKSGTGVIYFGYPTDNYSRNIVDILNEVVSEYGYDKIYYYNIKPIMSSVVIDNDNKVVLNKGNAFYYELLSILNDFLNYYTVLDNNNEEVILEEKKIEVPSVIFVKEGKITEVVDNIEDKEELKEIYKENLEK